MIARYRICFIFSDEKGLDEIIKQLMEQPGIHTVYAEGYVEGGITLSYIYENGFTEEQKQEAETLIRVIQKLEKSYEPDHSLEFSDFIDDCRTELLGLIIAALNALFLYVCLLKKRIPVYTVLKLQGLTNGRLRQMLLLEFLFIYLAVCLLSAAVYGIFARVVGRQPYELYQDGK